MFWFWFFVVYAVVLWMIHVVWTLRRDRREPEHGVPMRTLRDYWLIDRWGGASG